MGKGSLVDTGPGPAPHGGQERPDRGEIVAALEAVHDPHVPVSLRRMGMLRDIGISDQGTVKVSVCIPCMACPGTALLRESVREAVMAVNGVNDVIVEEGWHLPWSRDMVDADVQDLMRVNGIQI